MKKWAKTLGLLCVLVVGLTAGLAGCATVSNITNSYEEVIYNGNSAVNVDGYLYYGNSAVDIDEITTNSLYKSYAKISYLSRVNMNDDLEATSADYSPATASKVSSEVTAYEGNFMFVLGQYIYYATPNTQKAEDSDGEVSNYFNYTCIYKSKLNGNSKKKLYTTNGEISEIEVLKSDGKYYIVMLSGDDLIKIDLSSGKSTVLAEEVTSVAMPETYQKDVAGSTLDWNGYVYYTVSITSEGGSGNSYNAVYKVDLLGGDPVKVYSTATTDIEFIDRVKDVVFYTETNNSQSAVYMLDLANGTFSSTNSAFLSTSSTISSISLLVASSGRELGYLYLIDDTTLGYYNASTGKNGVLTLNADDAEITDYNILTISGRTIYLSTTTAVYKVDISELFNAGTTSFECTELVSMTAIYDGNLCAFDGTYVYFYAQLEDLDDEDSDEEDEDSDEETDENYYLYRVKANGSGSYELLGLTQISSRRS